MRSITVGTAREKHEWLSTRTDRQREAGYLLFPFRDGVGHEDVLGDVLVAFSRALQLLPKKPDMNATDCS